MTPPTRSRNYASLTASGLASRLRCARNSSGKNTLVGYVGQLPADHRPRGYDVHALSPRPNQIPGALEVAVAREQEGEVEVVGLVDEVESQLRVNVRLQEAFADVLVADDLSRLASNDEVGMQRLCLGTPASEPASLG